MGLAWSCLQKASLKLQERIDKQINYNHTSSTAQGGGGSFKNGKPIGEVSWCDAKMAERTH